MASSETAMVLPLDNTKPSAPTASSKRDRKKHYIYNRLIALENKMSHDKDAKYRDQLQKIQVDTALVQRFDPYVSNSLEILDEMREQQQKVHASGNPPLENARSILDMAGPRFQDWAQSVVDVHEVRDFHLTRQHHEYNCRRQQYHNTYKYKVETAKREHESLCSTLRDRLINALSSKKNRLLKEKEALEISDSSALLLHPNQFSFTNPGSPGGTHSKRATRLRKDAEDYASLADTKKRKRNGDEESGPPPLRRALDTSQATPMWQSEKLRQSAKSSGPLYSVDKLFTDKELSLAYNTAAIAAHKYVLRRCGGNNDGDDDSPSASSSSSQDDDAGPLSRAMERQASHQTRSTKNSQIPNFTDDRILGWEAISNFEIPTNLDRIHESEAPKMPPLQPQQYLKNNLRPSDQNFPTQLSNDDVNSDIAIMNVFKQYDKSHRPGAALEHPNGLRRLLEAASVPLSEGKYVTYLGGTRQHPNKVDRDLHLKPSNIRDEPVATNPASQNSTPMSRVGSTRGRGRKH